MEPARYQLHPNFQVQTFLKEIIAYFKETYNITMQFAVNSWFFPQVAEQNHVKILIATIIKLVIFKSKYKNQLPNIPYLHSLGEVGGAPTPLGFRTLERV